MSRQGISNADYAILQAASTDNISSLIDAPDNPPPEVGTEVLPPNLQTKLSECNGNDSCKLVGYDFINDTGTKASASPYLIQLSTASSNADKTDVSVLAKVGTTSVTSLGIPVDNLDAHYDSNHLQLTPAIVSGPIGYSMLEGETISGTPMSTVSGTSADACAATCTDTTNCKGFNFNETSSSCALFPLVDTEAILGADVGGGSNTIHSLGLTLRSPGVTSLAVGQTIEGLEEYINGTVTITGVTAGSSTSFQVGFSEQIVNLIRANTPFRIKAQTTLNSVATLQAYASQIDHIKNIGVNGSETYGYKANFVIQAIPGLPTITSGAVTVTGQGGVSATTFNYPLQSPPNYTEHIKANPNPSPTKLIQPASSLIIPVNLDTPSNPVISSAILGDGCTTGLIQNTIRPRTSYSYTYGQDQDDQTIIKIEKQTRTECENQCNLMSACNGYISYTNSNPNSKDDCYLIRYYPSAYNRAKSIRASREDAVLTPTCTTCDSTCKTSMIAMSQTPVAVTFQIPENATLPNTALTGTRIELKAIELTATLGQSSPVPSDRIIGWTGTLGGIPVTVKSYTTSTITFSFPSQTYSAIPAGTVTLSDTQGRTCQDIKACNASIQRLLDSSTTRPFSTNDLVACAGCNERAFKTPLGNLSKLREYLWFENAGSFSCPVDPQGRQLDDNCNPVCTTPTNGDTAVYDSASDACRVTCRSGFYWNSTTKECVSCPAVTLPTNVIFQIAPMCLGTCAHASGTTPDNMSFASTTGSDGFVNACTVACSSGNLPNPSNTRCCSTSPAGLPSGTTITGFTSDDCSTYTVTCSGGTLANSTNTRCCPVVTPPNGTKITGYSDDCATPICDRADGDNDFIQTVASASGPSCSVTCQTPPAAQHGTTAAVETRNITQADVVLPTNSSFTTLASSAVEFTSPGDNIQTNIGTYIFEPFGSRAAIYTGSGTPTQYNLPADKTFKVQFPFKIKIQSIQFWKTQGVTSVGINLKNVRDGTDVLNETFNFGSSTYTTQTSGFGRFLTLTFGGSGTVAYKITATVQKVCTVTCSEGGSNGRPVLDERTCKMLCNQGYSISGNGCSSCPPATLDPGTGVVFGAGGVGCAGSCYVFDPIGTNSLSSLSDAVATPSTFQTTATGNARVCRIQSCPSGRTQYTTASSTTLNNSGCCPIPTIKNSANTDIYDSGITWRYPQGSASTSMSTAACTLSCDLPADNPYGMTTTLAATGRSCVRNCPIVSLSSSTPGFTVTNNTGKCVPVCTPSTPDDNSTTSASYSNGTVSCTKNCNENFAKDTATSKCCPIYSVGQNITVSYGTSATTCTTTCTATASDSSSYVNISKDDNRKTCSITCTEKGTDDTGTTGSYSQDGKCTFSCAVSSPTTTPNATANPATNASSKPYCSFGCSSGYYKSLGASKCCANITPNTGTTFTKRNDATCDFDCSLSDTTTYPSANYTSTASGRACVLGCVTPSAPTGTTATTPTVAGRCTNFTCSLASDYSSTNCDVSTSTTTQSCTIGCKTVNTPAGTKVTKQPTVAGKCIDFECGTVDTTGAYTTSSVTSTHSCAEITCASGYVNVNQDVLTSWTRVCCPSITPYDGTRVNYGWDNYGNHTCDFTCSLESGYSNMTYWAKPRTDGVRGCGLYAPTYTAWSAWSTCNAECYGWQKRTRTQTDGNAVGAVQTETQRCNTDAFNNCLVRFYSGCNYDGNRSGTMLPEWDYDMPWGATFVHMKGSTRAPYINSAGQVVLPLDSRMTLNGTSVTTYMGVRNDDLLSVRIPSGVKLTVYQHNAFGGLSFTMSGNDPNTKNRQFCNTDKWWADGGGRTSSIKVQFDTPPPP